MMSRKPYRSKRPQQSSPQSDKGHPAKDTIIAQAHARYGSDAATAIAYCGMDAWFEGEEVEFRRFAEMFRRLRN
jgi:hypothetical protein